MSKQQFICKRQLWGIYFKMCCWAVVGSMWSFSLVAQDIHFSQFYEAQLRRSPALAGIFTGDVRYQGVYRSQWGSITAPFVTGSVSGDVKLPVNGTDDYISIGGYLGMDRAGDTRFSTNELMPVINYHKSLGGSSNTYLSLGLSGGITQRSIDGSKITTASQFDASGYNAALDINENNINYNLIYGNANVGLSLNGAIAGSEYDNYYFGVAYHHFNRPGNSFYRNPSIELNAKWVYSAGVKFGLGPQASITLQADHTRQGAYNETIGGALVGYALQEYDFFESQYNLYFGAFFRWKDAIVPIIKLEYQPFSVGLSYDINTSLLRTASQGVGGFELSISYQGFTNGGGSSKNAVKCPRF